MDQIEQILRDTISWYSSGGGINNRAFNLSQPEKQAYAVNVFDAPIHKFPAAIVVMAHIEDDFIVIDADNTDRPLVDKLVEAGIPREKIILAYVGEPIPAAEM